MFAVLNSNGVDTPLIWVGKLAGSTNDVTVGVPLGMEPPDINTRMKSDSKSRLTELISVKQFKTCRD